MKKLFTIFLLIFFSGYGYSDDAYDCPDGVTIPNSLIGVWSRKIERNNQAGRQEIQFTQGCKFFFTEYGGGKFMSEWLQDLNANKQYIFKQRNGQKILSVSNNAFIIEETKDYVSIRDINLDSLVNEWEMISSYDNSSYRMENNDKSIFIPFDWEDGKLVEVEFRKQN